MLDIRSGTNRMALFAGEPIEADPSPRLITGKKPGCKPETCKGGASNLALLDQVRQAIRTRHYNYRTEKAYIHWIRRFSLLFNTCHPAEMDEAEIGWFLSNLASESPVSASTQNQALNALLVLYHEVFSKEIDYVNGIVWAKRSSRLPVILTRHQQVRAILALLEGPEGIMGMLLSGADLRLTECLRLLVKDFDSSHNEIRVRSGKGGKDRVTIAECRRASGRQGS